MYHLVARQGVLINYKPLQQLPEPTVPVSVIISARNEEENLKNNLPAILEQDYPDFEVIVVNDCSVDGSDLLLLELQQQYPQLKIVTVTEHARFKTGKKFALTLGIKAAKNEHLIFTDADCVPASKNWLKRLAVNYTTKAQIVLGYSPYAKGKGFINAFTRFETLKTAANYLSAAIRGDAYMGIGRNLSYTKTLFFAGKGFANHIHLLPGDDDLFVNQNATPTNTIIEIHPDTFMYTTAKSTLSGWYRQKTRHMGVGKFYKNSHRRMLTADAMSGFAFYTLIVLCLVFNVEPLMALSLYLVRLLAQILIYNKIFKTLSEKSLLFFLPVLDLIYYVYLNLFGLIGTFKKTTQWK